MAEVATIEFRDLDSDDEAFAHVRAAPGIVTLAVSLRNDGDYLVGLPVSAARELVAALRRALVIAGASPSEGRG